MESVILRLYGVSGMALVDYLAGTMVLALCSVILGEFTISVAYLVNRDYISNLNGKLARYNELSKTADEAGLETAYRACNKRASDAYGRLFFNQVALSAASLWPAFFALAFMQKHFSRVLLPVAFTGKSANYVFIFLICYIAARMIFKRIKPFLPYFSSVGKLLESEPAETRASLPAPMA